MSFQILGTGSALPACRKTNDDLSQLVDTSDEWITTRTGIKERRILTTETVTEIAVAAAKNAGGDRCPAGRAASCGQFTLPRLRVS